MKQKLLEALSLLYPNEKQYILDRCVENYITHVMSEICIQILYMKSDDIEMAFPFDEVNRACGKVKLSTGIAYTFNLMQGDTTTSLVIQTYTGNSISGKVSKVIYNPIYKKDIMEEIKNLSIELNPKHLEELQAKANHSIDIDIDALDSFIEATRETLNQSNLNEIYQEKLMRNYRIALQLKQDHKSKDDVHYVDEYWEDIDSGRIYGHGLSLQRIPKEVRHAALGHCHKYDFKASSFALMTDLALQHAPELKVAALKDYIKHRSAIRTRIAADIGVSDVRMKGIFTALGFGAELKDNFHNAIRKKLSEEQFTKLAANTEFSMIYRQLKDVSEVIDIMYPITGFTLHGKEFTTNDPVTGKKRTKNQKLAWIYQSLESLALSVFSDLSDSTAILQCHDCLYFKKPLPLRELQDIKWKLSNMFPLLTFEHEQIFPIHSHKTHIEQEKAKLVTEYIHLSNIEEQERIAEDYVPINVGTGSVKVNKDYSTETKAQYELRRRQQFLIDTNIPNEQEEEVYFKDSYFKNTH